MERWTIYCHTHVESGRRYIGLTSRTMERRWSQHIVQSRNLKGNRSHFANAIRKYGKDAFTHEVLAQSWDLDSANVTEVIIIEQEGTRDPEKGFNILKGGGSQPNPIRKNPWDRPEFRKKATAALRRRAADPLLRAKISAANKRRSPELIARIALSNKGRTPNRSAVENSVANRRAKANIPKTHMTCKRHGLVLNTDCTKRVRRGIVQLSCKECARIRYDDFCVRRGKNSIVCLFMRSGSV